MVHLFSKSGLDLEAGSASTRFDDVRVHEFKSALAEVVSNEVDDSAIEIWVEFLFDSQLNAEEVRHTVLLSHVAVKIQIIGKTAAAAALHSYAKNCAIRHALLAENALDFTGRCFRHCHWHASKSS